MPNRTSLTAGDRRSLREQFRAACCQERGLPAVDRRAPAPEQVRQALAAERLGGRPALDVLFDLVERREGSRPANAEFAVRSALADAGLVNVFTDAIGASVMQGYRETFDSIAAWTRREVVSRRRADRVRLSAPPHLAPVPRGAAPVEAAGQFDVLEQYELQRFALYRRIDEQDLLGMLPDVVTTIPMELGRAAARLPVDLAFVELLRNRETGDGTPLFHADHGNTFTGDLTGDNLDEAMQKLIEQSEADVDLDLQPAALLVPPALAGTARKLARERTLDTDGDLTVVASQRLASVRDPATGERLTAESPRWYLCAGAEHAPVEVVFLDKREPSIGHGPLTDGSFGIWFDVRLYAAARAVRPRSIVRYVVSE